MARNAVCVDNARCCSNCGNIGLLRSRHRQPARCLGHASRIHRRDGRIGRGHHRPATDGEMDGSRHSGRWHCRHHARRDRNAAGKIHRFDGWSRQLGDRNRRTCRLAAGLTADAGGTPRRARAGRPLPMADDIFSPALDSRSASVEQPKVVPMVRNSKSNKNRLRVRRVVDVPLREVSGICLRRSRNGLMFLIAVGDRVAKIAWFSQPRGDGGRIDWHTKNIAKLSGSTLPKRDSQIEAVCADGLGRVLLLQETPPRVELIDPKALKVAASIDLEVEGRGAIARAWSDPNGSRGEGVVLLPGGHLLIAKEKKPAALIEFGPPDSPSRGLARGGALPDGARWPIRKGGHRFVALAIWRPDKTLAKTCADFSDLEIGPDGRLYLLSDQSSTIARLDDLPAGGGTTALVDAWYLGDLDGKPEGLAFTAQGRAIVGLDTRKPRRNLVLLEPPVAQLRGRGQSLS